MHPGGSFGDFSVYSLDVARDPSRLQGPHGLLDRSDERLLFLLPRLLPRAFQFLLTPLQLLLQTIQGVPPRLPVRPEKAD